MKRLNLIIAGIGIILIAGAALLAFDFYTYAHRPAGPDAARVVFNVEPGESLDALAQRLQAAGILRGAGRFRLLARGRRDDKRLKAGEYLLAATMSPLQILDVLVAGKVFLHTVTIPEGYTLRQIADEVDRLGLAPRGAFMETATDPGVAASFGLRGKTMEGFLFPDTYYFPKGLSPLVMITKMVERFNEQFAPIWHERAGQLGMSVYQIVTLASIIEKETGAPFERPLISSVFHNRLKKKMRLDSDPTVIYGIENFDGDIKRKHLTMRTPYNTYLIKGLPAGPIANPGRAAIEAALFPAQTEYLYFVSKKDSTHHFSTTIQEHNQAVRNYQLRKKP